MGELQKAIYGKLKQSSQLAELATVGDCIAADQPMPYVQVGEGTERPWDDFNQQGRELTITLHVWSDAPGNAQALAIASVLHAELDGAVLTGTGWTFVDLAFEWQQTMLDPDGKTRHIPVRFRCLMQAI